MESIKKFITENQSIFYVDLSTGSFEDMINHQEVEVEIGNKCLTYKLVYWGVFEYTKEQIADDTHITKTLKDVEFDGKTFTAGDKSITINNLSNRLYYNEDQKQLIATDSYVGIKSPPPF